MLLKRVFAGVTSNLYLQAISTLIQLFGVPLCLTYWGEVYYGEWLLLFTIPGYLSVSDFGLGTSSTAEMTMMAEDQRHKDIQPLLQSTFWFIVLWGLIPFSILYLSNYVLPWHTWLKLQVVSEVEFRSTFPLLVLYIYLSLFLTVPLNYYRVIKKYNIERYISTVHKGLEFVVLLFLVIAGFGIFQVALGYLILRTCLLGYILFDLYRRSSYFRLWPVRVHFKQVRKVLKPGVSGLFFYLGGNILLQGTSTIVGLNLGAKTLVMFNTVRTLVNMAKQIINIINLSVYSEFSYAYGASNMNLFHRLIRSSLVINVVLSFLACIMLFFLSNFILLWWTNGVVEADALFLGLFLLYTFLGSISSVALTVLLSINIFKYSGYLYLGLISTLLVVNAIWIQSLGLPFLLATLVIFECIFIWLTYKILFSIMESDWTQLLKGISLRDFITSQFQSRLGIK
jgi:O-antigen/teichoic acid export membrane protein